MMTSNNIDFSQNISLSDVNMIGTQYGWICPICGTVYSPTCHTCYKCSDQQVVSYGGNTTITS